MYNKRQYVNKNTSMPVKGIYSFVHTVFRDDGECVMWRRRHRLFISLFYFGANVEMFTQIIAQGHFK